MLTTRCNTPTRHWLLLLSLLFRKILVVPMAALIPHFQTSKRFSEFDYSTKTPSAYDFVLLDVVGFVLKWMEVNFRWIAQGLIAETLVASYV